MFKIVLSATTAAAMAAVITSFAVPNGGAAVATSLLSGIVVAAFLSFAHFEQN